MPEGRAEGRIAVIVAIDFAGYSRLIRADEAGTLAVTKGHREACLPIGVQHGARFVGDAGDGLLLEFPSATEAVNCSVEINAMMVERNADVPDGKKIFFIVGIDHGEVLIDGLDIDGDGVNIAVHLQALAKPGDICISKTVRDNFRDRMEIKFEDMGEVQVKNITRPVQAFRVSVDGEAAHQSSPKPARLKWLIAASAIALGALILVAGLAWWW